MKYLGFNNSFKVVLLLMLLLVAASPALFAQNEANAVIIQKFQETINRLDQSLEANSGCDPYGFRVSIRVVMDENGKEIPLEQFPVDRLQAIAAQFMTRQRFDRFDMDASPTVFNNKGFFIYSAGLTGITLAPDPREFDLVATHYSETVSVNGVVKRLIVQVHAFAIVEKPEDGSILSTLYYYDKDGGKTLWDHQTWKNIDPHVAYVRVGPGNDNTNSRKGEGDFERTSVSDITIARIYNPGHYLPQIRFRECLQDFTDPIRFEELEAIVKTTEQVSWADFKEFEDGTVVPLTKLRAARTKAPDFVSYFSTGNTVRGFIRDETGNPIQGKAIVVLEPMFSPGPDKKEVESLPGGMYEFVEVESGVYKVYVQGQDDRFERVEVCNCPQKNEGPNRIYEAGIRLATTYDIYVSATLRNVPAGGGYIGSYEVVWRNVRIAFMDNEDDIPFIDADFFETGETGFDDDDEDIEWLYEQPDDGSEIIEIDTQSEYVSQRLTPPYRVKYPYGIETFYSDEESNIPEAIKNLDGARIRPGDWAVNHFYIQRTWEFPQIHVEFSIDWDGEDVQILSGAGPADDGFISGFKWEHLDDDIMEKLKRGEAATKNLTNFYGSTMNVRFSPNK